MDLTKVGIPLKYQHYTYDTAMSLFVKDSRESADEFLAKETLGLYVFGTPGSGKTTYCVGILQKLISERVQCYRSSLEALVNSYVKNDYDIPGKYSQPSVVIIEDLSLEPSILGRKLLEGVVKWRSEQLKRTIITANFSPDNFVRAYGDSVFSIVRSTYKKVRMPNVDFRQGV